MKPILPSPLKKNKYKLYFYRHSVRILYVSISIYIGPNSAYFTPKYNIMPATNNSRWSKLHVHI